MDSSSTADLPYLDMRRDGEFACCGIWSDDVGASPFFFFSLVFYICIVSFDRFAFSKRYKTLAGTAIDRHCGIATVLCVHFRSVSCYVIEAMKGEKTRKYLPYFYGPKVQLSKKLDLFFESLIVDFMVKKKSVRLAPCWGENYQS
jgi:hypothetical protein